MGVNELAATQDENHAWAAAIAERFDIYELEAMCTWLDENISLNQQRLESVTSRIGLVVTVSVAELALLAASVTTRAWPLTVMAVMVASLALLIGTLGLRSIYGTDRDPGRTYRSLWHAGRSGEVLAVLYRRRSVLYDQQRRVIETRSAALKHSAWIAGFGAMLAATAVLVSRLP